MQHQPRSLRAALRSAALRSAAVLLAALLLPAAAGAQATGLAADECYGFAFGRWTPPLDLGAAGHRATPPGDVAQAPGGRDWAAAVASGRDTTLMLFPAWWPAGVLVRFPGGVRTPSDTVRGTATALVADGRVRNPESVVLAWPVSCGGRAPDRSSGRRVRVGADTTSADTTSADTSGADTTRPDPTGVARRPVSAPGGRPHRPR